MFKQNKPSIYSKSPLILPPSPEKYATNEIAKPVTTGKGPDIYVDGSLSFTFGCNKGKYFSRGSTPDFNQAADSAKSNQTNVTLTQFDRVVQRERVALARLREEIAKDVTLWTEIMEGITSIAKTTVIDPIDPIDPQTKDVATTIPMKIQNQNPIQDIPLPKAFVEN